MKLLLPVDETYLANLISQLELCHAEKSLDYLKRLARDENTEDKLDNLRFLSDAIFYLGMFTVGTHENQYLHWMKEKAMRICDFTEESLTASPIDMPILLEDGGLILTEDGLFYLQQE